MALNTSDAEIQRLRQRSKAVLTHRTPKLFPFAGELQGTLADGFAERLVGGVGVEPFGLRLPLVSQEVNQTQGLTLRTQLPFGVLRVSGALGSSRSDFLSRRT